MDCRRIFYGFLAGIFACLFAWILVIIGTPVPDAYGGTYRNDSGHTKVWDGTTVDPGETIQSYSLLDQIDSATWTKVSDEPYYPLLYNDEIVTTTAQNQTATVPIEITSTSIRLTNLTATGGGNTWAASTVYALNDAVLPSTLTGYVYQATDIYTGVSTWAAGASYALGDKVKAVTVNGYIYQCSVAGTSGTAEPIWPTTIGATVVDGTATWTCQDYAGTSGASEPSPWPTTAGDTIVDNYVTWTAVDNSNDARVMVYPNSTANPYYAILEPMTSNNDRDEMTITNTKRAIDTLYLYCGSPVGCRIKVEVRP